MEERDGPTPTIAPWSALGAGLWFVWNAGATVTDRDAGELGAAAFLLDVAHPTGFPLDMAVFRLAALLPVGDVAFRMNLAVALWSALACGILTAITERAAREVPAPWRHAVALTTAALVACSPTVLRAATAVEVYASSLCVALAALGVLWLGDLPDAARARLAALAAGLTLTLHTSARPAAALALVLLLARRVTSRPWSARTRTLAVVVGAGLATLPLVGYLPAASMRDGPIDWNDPETPRALLDHLSAVSIRAAYAHRMLVPWRIPEDLLRAGELLLEDLGALALVSAVVGCVLAARHAVGRVLVVLALADLAYAVAINPMGMVDRQTFFHTEACLAAVAMFPWVRALRAGEAWRVRAAGMALACVGLFALWRCDTTWAARADGWSAAEILGGAGALGAVPPRALVLCASDDLCGGALYAQEVEGERPDVTVLPRQHVAYAWTWRRLDARRLGRSITVPPGREGDPAQVDVRLRALLEQAREHVRWESAEASDEALWRTFPRPGSSETPALGAIGAPITDVDVHAARWVRERLPPSRGAGARWVGGMTLFGAASRLARPDLQRAVPLWQETLRVNPGHVSAHTNLGVAASRRGDLPRAVALTQRALALDPERPVAWRNLRDYLAALGDREGALDADREYRRRR